MKLVARHRISGAGSLRSLGFAKFGRCAVTLTLCFDLNLIGICRRLITNSSDRILRQFNLPTYPTHAEEGDLIEQELEPTYRFSDPINKVAWNNMSYSPDGEWLAGGESCAGTRQIHC